MALGVAATGVGDIVGSGDDGCEWPEVADLAGEDGMAFLPLGKDIGTTAMATRRRKKALIDGGGRKL